LILSILIDILYSFFFKKNAEEHNANEQNDANDQALAVARLQILQQILHRRSLYDPAFGDSWSNYLEKKRALFDPAYGDWANSFKRSDD
jgi:hypothetical protein